MEGKIRVELKELDAGSWGYDVQILEESSTVQDYLEEMNRFQEERVAPCGGCTNCCWERVPLTAADVAVYLTAAWEDSKAKNSGRRAAAPGPADQGIALETVTEFLRRYGRVRADRGVVDITLRQEANGACCFLDQERRRCGRWPLRSLVCQTYVCLPQSRRAAALRQQIVNEGENELIRLYAGEAAERGKNPWAEGQTAQVDWKAYRGRGFTPPALKASLADGGEGKGAFSHFCGIQSYREIRIKDVVTKELWQLLQKD